MAEKEEKGTLSQEDAGKSSRPSSPAKDSSGELTGTMEFLLRPESGQETSAAEPSKTEKDKETPPEDRDREGQLMDQDPNVDTGKLSPLGEGGEEEIGEELKGAEKPTELDEKDSKRLDKHPRFKEVITERNDARTERDGFRDRALKAEGRIEALERQMQALYAKGPSSVEEETVDFDDISDMTDGQISEAFNDNAKQFLGNFARQIRHELRKEMTQEMQNKSAEDKVEQTYTKYSQDHPEFAEMWNSGQITAFMNANPGHNAISAHQILMAEKRDQGRKAEIDAAVQKAIKETEARVIANFKAKGGAKTLGEGPPPPTGGKVHEETAPELKDPKSFGGLTSVLASRLRDRRAKNV